MPARHFAAVATGDADDRILKIERARNSPICDIRFDDAAAGRLATDYLISLGHRKCVHLRGPERPLQPAAPARLPRGADHSGAVAPARAVPAGAGAAAPRGRRHRSACRQPAARDRGLRRPLRRGGAAGRPPRRLAGAEDLSVVGIDDIQFAAYTNPGLTTVAQPKQELGALAVDALLSHERRRRAGKRMLDGSSWCASRRRRPMPPSSSRGRNGKDGRAADDGTMQAIDTRVAGQEIGAHGGPPAPVGIRTQALRRLRRDPVFDVRLQRPRVPRAGRHLRRPARRSPDRAPAERAVRQRPRPERPADRHHAAHLPRQRRDAQPPRQPVHPRRRRARPRPARPSPLRRPDLAARGDRRHRARPRHRRLARAARRLPRRLGGRPSSTG